MAKVVLVEDELTMVQMVAELLREDGHEVFPCTNANTAMDALASHQPEIVVTDLYLDRSRASGMEILQKARALAPPPVVIVMTGHGSIETAVEAMRLGAFDYLEKPFKLEHLRLCVQRALTYGAAVVETVSLRRQLKKKYQFSQIVGNASKMLDVFRMIERVSNTDSTVLVLGESGTGKELVARALHFNSRRQHGPFIPINCSALPENLLESELFGHRKGSFTGAIADKKGLFQEADGGTIFLDEVGTMSPLLQNRLLRVLQEREVRRVGDNTSFYVNVRVVAASNEPLEQRIKEGGFREDLYYRLNVIPIHLPSLRDRSDDIPLLVAHFLKDKVSPHNGQPFRVTRKAIEVLCAHKWPGNVRELENAIERACALCEGDLIHIGDLPEVLRQLATSADTDTEFINRDLPDDASGLRLEASELPGEASHSAAGNGTESNGAPAPVMDARNFVPLKTFLRDQECAHLRRALEVTSGDKEKAALLLGVSLATLYRKLAEEQLA